MKNIKIIAVFLMLLFIALPVTSSIGAVSEKKENESTKLQYIFFRSDGSKIIEEITINSEDIDIFNKIISRIFEKITSKNYFDIKDVINDLELEFGRNKIISLLSLISLIKPLQKRVLIFSDGYGNKFDIHLRTKLSIHRRFTFWYYRNNNDAILKGRTVIIDPIPNSLLKFFKFVDGAQIGIMNKFTGLYLRIPGRFMKDKQSHTFFFGYAKKVRAFDLPDFSTII